jgi:NAD(P)-dependent dehydrogenase (short-subunit alcohol dehydrogenase family)
VREAVDKLNALPGIKGKAIGISANVSSTEEIQALVDQVKRSESQLDILIANAGATWGGPFESSPDWASQKVVDLNVRGVFNLVRLYASPLTHWLNWMCRVQTVDLSIANPWRGADSPPSSKHPEHQPRPPAS